MTTVLPVERSLVHRAVRRVPWWGWVSAGVVVIVALVAVLGGFRDRAPSAVPVLGLGESWTGGEVRTTINDVFVTDVKPLSGYAVEDELYVVVDVTLENLTDGPTLFGVDAVLIELPGVVDSSDDPDAVIEQRTGDGVQFVQPGVTTDVYFLWRMETGDVEADDTIYLGFFERFPIADDPVFGDTAYTGPRFVARLETTVRQGPMGEEG